MRSLDPSFDERDHGFPGMYHLLLASDLVTVRGNIVYDIRADDV